MEIDRSKIPANKVYEKHCKGIMWSAILTFAVIGVFIAFLFLPIFAYFPAGGERVDMNGLNFIGYVIRHWVKGLYNPEFDRFNASVSSYNGSLTLLSLIAENQPTMEIIVVTLLLISVIFALVALFYGLVFLFRGHAKNTLMISAMAHSVTTFFSLFILMLFLYFLLCRKMFVECNIMEHIRFFITPFILILAFLALAIILSQIYKKTLRRRVYILEYKPKPLDFAKKDSLIYQYFKNFPKRTYTIGDKAFENENLLTEALIPEGIVALGDSAFSNCINLEKVSIASTVKKIGDKCFYHASILKSITFAGTLEEWNAIEKGEGWMDNSAIEYVEATDGKLNLK